MTSPQPGKAPPVGEGLAELSDRHGHEWEATTKPLSQERDVDQPEDQGGPQG
jgi:hypothetical protein